jgi:hypothetical protein
MILERKRKNGNCKSDISGSDPANLAESRWGTEIMAYHVPQLRRHQSSLATRSRRVDGCSRMQQRAARKEKDEGGVSCVGLSLSCGLLIVFQYSGVQCIHAQLAHFKYFHPTGQTKRCNSPLFVLYTCTSANRFFHPRKCPVLNPSHTRQMRDGLRPAKCGEAPKAGQVLIL